MDADIAPGPWRRAKWLVARNPARAEALHEAAGCSVLTANGPMIGHHGTHPKRSKRVMEAMLQMKKMDIARLEQAYARP